MKKINGYRQVRYEARIVAEYGNGVLRGDRYLWEQIQRVPEGWTQKFLAPKELCELAARHEQVVLLIDRNPDNIADVCAYMTARNLPCGTAFTVSVEELADILEQQHFDMYVLSAEGVLLGAASHEDREVDGVRQIWSPVPPSTQEPKGLS